MSLRILPDCIEQHTNTYSRMMRTFPNPSDHRLHVVGFSRGVTSAVVSHLVKQKHPGHTILLWHDTQEEPEDNDRFMLEVSTYLGLAITEYSLGISVSELFEDTGHLGNNKMTPCSREMKQDLSKVFCLLLKRAGFQVTLHLGFDHNELTRWSNAIQRYAALDVQVEADLIGQQWEKTQCIDLVENCWGIRCPDAYEHFDHANCRGCVKGGLAYWGQVYLYDREVWEKRADQEDAFGHTILDTRIAGPYPHGSLRALLPRCLENAAKWRAKKAKGEHSPLIGLPCGCGK